MLLKSGGTSGAIRDHVKNYKQLHLFEYVTKGVVRYVGEFRYLDHHHEDRPDRNGENRQAIIFHLELLPSDVKFVADSNPSIKLETKSLKELRDIALTAATLRAPLVTRVSSTALRAAAVRAYALKRASGICELCKKPAPFSTNQGPYLEVHHITRLSDGGPDHPDRVAAICPNCHSEIHFGVNGKALNAMLFAYLLSTCET